jgi:hypothetical protein
MATAYPHRINKDKTVDSICPRCYRTIASTRDSWDLGKQEQEHQCEPFRIAELEKRTKQDRSDGWAAF